MNRKWICLAAACLALMMLAGCAIRLHINEKETSVEELLENHYFIIPNEGLADSPA